MTRRHLALPFLFALTTLPSACTFGGGLTDTDDGETAGDEVDEGESTADTTTGTGTTGGTESVSIYDIRQGNVPLQSNVSVMNVVVTSPMVIEDDDDDGVPDSATVYVQEIDGGEYSGISLYLWNEPAAALTLQPGDRVDLVGEYDEFFDASQIIIKNAGDVTVTGDEALPAPSVVSAADIASDNAGAEPWEGVRVAVNDATIANTNDGFGQWVLDGGALVGYLFTELPTAQAGGTYDSVTGILYYTFEEYKLGPTGEADFGAYTPPMSSSTTIPDIQQGNVAEDSIVEVSGVIATSGFTWSNDDSAAFFVQDPAGGQYSGIQVFVGNTAGLDIQPGDILDITGATYEEFFDMSQLVVADASGITETGSGPAPAPEVIANPADIATNGAMAEAYESVLVSVENVTVTDVNPDAPDEFGEFAVDGGLRVDDVFFAIDDWMKPAMGAGFASITGPLVYAFSNFKLEPRDPSDLVAN